MRALALHLPTLVLMMALLLHLTPRTNAAPRHQQRDQTKTETADVEETQLPTASSRSCSNQAADAARSAAKTCGTLPVEEALRSVTMPTAAAHRAGDALAALGFATALDLQLLGGGEATAELLAELKAGGLSPADRA